MNFVVLDATVVVKWFLPAKDEPLTEEAIRVFTKFRRDEIRVIAPDFLSAECANVLWKAARSGRLQRDQCETAMATLLNWNFAVVPTAELLQLAFAMAVANGRTVYDSLYVALALRSRCDLITADERLANALGSQFPVRWLGSFSIT